MGIDNSCIIPLVFIIAAVIVFLVCKDKEVAKSSFILLIFISFLLFCMEIVLYKNEIFNNSNNFNKMKIVSENTEQTLYYTSIYLKDEDSITYILKDGSKFKISKKKILSTKKGNENKIIIKDIQFDYICTDIAEKIADNLIDKNILHKQVYEIYNK